MDETKSCQVITSKHLYFHFNPDSIIKHKDKKADLSYTEIDISLYQRKQAGFLTKYPLRWLIELEKRYESNNHPTYKITKWMNTKHNIIHTSKIHLANNSEQVVIEVYLSTGIVMVKGNLYVEWIADEFNSLLKDVAEAQIEEPTSSSPQNISISTSSMIITDHSPAIVRFTKPTLDLTVEDSIIANPPNNPHLSPPISVTLSPLIENSARKLASEAISAALAEEQSSNMQKHLDSLEHQIESIRNDFSMVQMEGIMSNKIASVRSTLIAKLNSGMQSFESAFLEKIENMNKKFEDKTKSLKQQNKDLISNQAALKEKITSLETQLAEINNQPQNTTSPTVQAAPIKPVNTLPSVTQTTSVILPINQTIPKNDHKTLTRTMPTPLTSSTSTNTCHPTNGGSIEPSDQTPNLRKTKTVNMSDFIIIMDSNRKILEAKRMAFEPRQSVAIIPCSAYNKLPELLDTHDFPIAKFILIHLGVNDIDNCDPKSLTQNIHNIYKDMQTRFTKAKIFISEITPRMDMLDKMVQEVNERLRTIFDKKDTLIHHDNLRSKQYYRDNRHIKADKCSLLAGNVKNNIRRILKPRGYGPNARNNLQHHPVTNSGNTNKFPPPTNPKYNIHHTGNFITPNVHNNLQQQPVTNPSNTNTFSPPNNKYNLDHAGNFLPSNIYLPHQVQPSHIVGNNIPQFNTYPIQAIQNQRVKSYADTLKRPSPDVIMQQIHALLQQYSP